MQLTHNTYVHLFSITVMNFLGLDVVWGDNGDRGRAQWTRHFLCKYEDINSTPPPGTHVKTMLHLSVTPELGEERRILRTD